MSLASSRSTKGVTVLLLLAAALCTQGLRLCLHASHTEDAGHAHVVAVHLESDLLSRADSDDDTNDRHVAIGLALVKNLTDSPAFAVLLAVVLVLFLPPPHRRFAVSRDAVPVQSADRRLRPPLRAPPF